MKRPPVYRSTSARLAAIFFGTLIAVAAMTPAAVWVPLAQTLDETRPTAAWMHSLTIGPVANSEPVTIGGRHLAQRRGLSSASTEHLEIRRRGDTWWLRNVSLDRSALLIYSRTEEHRLRRWRLRAGDVFEVGSGVQIAVDDLADPLRKIGLSVTSAESGQHRFLVEHNAGFLARNNLVEGEEGAVRWLGVEACQRPANGFLGEVDQAKNRLRAFAGPVFTDVGRAIGLSAAPSKRRILQFGGSYSCGDRISIGGLPAGALWLEHEKGALYLGGRPVHFDAVTAMRKGGARQSLGVLDWPLAGEVPALDAEQPAPKQIILGRTRYDIRTTEAGALVLEAKSNQHKYISIVDETLDQSLTVANLLCVSGGGAAPCPDKRLPADMAGMVATFGLSSPGGLDRKNLSRGELAEELNAGRSDAPTAPVEYRRTSVLADMTFIYERVSMILRDGLAAMIGIATGSPALFGAAVIAFAPVLLRAGANAARQNLYVVELLPRNLEHHLLFLFGRPLEHGIRTASLIASIVLLYVVRAGPALDLMDRAWVLAAAWAVFSFAFAIDVFRRLREGWIWPFLMVLFWVAFGLLVFFGVGVLQMLAAGSANGTWDRFDVGHFSVVCYIFAALGFFLAVRTELFTALLGWFLLGTGKAAFWARTGAFSFVLLLSAIFLVKGSEEGLLGFLQPVEINKLALLVIAATLLARLDLEARFSRFTSRRMLWRWGAILFLIGLASFGSFVVVPFSLNDYSPLIISALLISLVVIIAYVATIVLIWHRRQAIGRMRAPPRRPAIALGNEWRDSRVVTASRLAGRIRKKLKRSLKPDFKASRPVALGAILVLLPFIVSCIAIVVVLEDVDTRRVGSLDERLSLSSMDRRAAVAFDHEAHSEWAEQLWSAWSVFPDETPPGCAWFQNWLCDEDNSIASFNGADVMAVGAIEDDLIAAFLVSRAGFDGVAALMVLQVVFVLIAAFAAVGVIRYEPGDMRDETFRLLLGLLAFGAAVLFALHWAISWSNLMSWIPIMGQPMTLVSHAKSHMLGMVTPCVMFILLALRLGSPLHRSGV